MSTPIRPTPIRTQPSAAPDDRRPRALQVIDRWLPRFAWMCLAAVVVIAAMILLVGDRWWLSTALTYLPRLPYAAPSAVVLAGCLFRRKWAAAAVSVVAVLVVLGPLMGLTIGRSAADGSQSLQLVSCNIQDARPRLELVLREIKRIDADVVCFQECSEDRPEFEAEWPDFHVVRDATFFVGSRWPIEKLGLVESDSMRRWCGAVFRVEHPTRPFVLVNVHLATARHGLSPLRDQDVSLGDALDQLGLHQALREGELFDLAKRVETYADEPVVLAGDFNQPSDAKFLTAAFGDWTNAFDAAGVGYGYTAPCDTARLWPHNSPWLRIDHVLVRDDFGVRTAKIGRTAGSDHRLIAAELVWD